MIKVYESFNISQVGQAASLLNAEGIETFVRNEFASSVMGEVPFVEVCPQLFILDAAEEERARELLRPFEYQAPAADWQCGQCGVEVDGPFGQCWNCGQLRPAGGDGSRARLPPTSVGGSLAADIPPIGREQGSLLQV